MITYHDGDLLESDCDIIAHQVNEYGVMSAGIAAQIKKKYFEAFLSYRSIADEAQRSNIIGYVHFVETGCSKNHIANCFSQRNGVTDYKALKRVVNSVKNYAISNNLHTVGIPYKYGCGIAHGDWKEVEKIWTDAFNDSHIELQIWRLDRV